MGKEINLSEETIETVYDALKGRAQEIKFILDSAGKNPKMTDEKVAHYKAKLCRVQDAMATFEELMK